MKILITGATGTIGRPLCEKLNTHQLVILTRNISKAKRVFADRAEYTSSLNNVDFNQIDAVINLAGEPIADKRWSTKQKSLVLESRVELTSLIAKKINTANTPPKVFISGSAIGYYGRQSADIAISENFTHCYPEFSHELCKDWENAALVCKNATRLCIIRTGIVLSREGGALTKLLPTFKLGLGSIVGSGQQMMSWIHIDDMVNGILYLLQNDNQAGVYNFTAPHPVTNEDFSTCLAQTLKRPCFLTMPSLVMNLLFGEMADLLLFGQKVLPTKLEENGYTFRFPHLEEALHAILKP
jgi:hypothetical protein